MNSHSLWIKSADALNSNFTGITTSSNTNKIGIQCICWFYSEGICYNARSYDRKMNSHFHVHINTFLIRLLLLILLLLLRSSSFAWGLLRLTSRCYGGSPFNIKYISCYLIKPLVLNFISTIFVSISTALLVQLPYSLISYLLINDCNKHCGGRKTEALMSNFCVTQPTFMAV
jgi:hypothetical protein